MAPRTVRNQGSEARDHLANERTFLAWLRTALGLVGLGMVVEKLEFEGSTSARVAAIVCIAFGALTLVYALRRYAQVAEHLADGMFPVAQRGPLVFGLLALGFALAAALYLLL